jgi:hypothetical protein
MRFTRFLRNPRVSPPEMVATARTRTATRVRGRHILAIQDTTTLRDDGRQCSLNLHAMIAVDAADGAPLGLVDAVFLGRTGGKKRLSDPDGGRPGGSRCGMRHRRRGSGRRYL